MVYLFVSLICWLIAANAVVQVPPAGLYFQLQSKAGYFGLDTCIASTGAGDVLQTSCDDSRTDQFWTVYDIQSDNSFKLKNEEYGTCISKAASGDITLAEGPCNVDFVNPLTGKTVNLKLKEFYWSLDDPADTWFRLKNKKNDKCMSAEWPLVKTASCDTDKKRKFKFVFEEYRVVSVSLDEHNAEIVQATVPFAAGEKLCDNTNGGSEPYVLSYSWEKSTTSTTSFEHSQGLEISVGTEFSTGVPGFGEASVSVDVTGSMQWTWGSEKSETQSFIGSATVSCAEGELIYAAAMLWAYDYDIPYTMTLQSVQDPSFYFYSYGTYKKANYYFLKGTSTCLGGTCLSD